MGGATKGLLAERAGEDLLKFSIRIRGERTTYGHQTTEGHRDLYGRKRW